MKHFKIIKRVYSCYCILIHTFTAMLIVFLSINWKLLGGENCNFVDCSAMAHEALKHAKGADLEVVVIDHHIGVEILSETIAIVNPNCVDE